MSSYARWLRGRFRVSPEAAADRDLGVLTARDWELAAEIRTKLLEAHDTGVPDGLHLSAICEVCSHLVGEVTAIVVDAELPLGRRSDTTYWQAGGDELMWNSPSTPDDFELLGDHEHNDDLPEGLVRFYRLAPMGPWKNCLIGNWVDVVASISLYDFDYFEEPSLNQVNKILGHGGQHLGMSGGVECPRNHLTEREWPAILEELRELGRVIDEEPPVRLTTGATREEVQIYNEWVSPFAEQFRVRRDARLATHQRRIS